jgi:hypothetical protein
MRGIRRHIHQVWLLVRLQDHGLAQYASKASGSATAEPS